MESTILYRRHFLNFRLQLESALEVGIVGSDRLRILCVDLKRLEQSPVLDVVTIF